MSYTANAKILRKTLDEAGTILTDEQALTAVGLYSVWNIGYSYKVNDRVQYRDILYKCIQAHTSQEEWEPNNTPDLWVKISIEGWPEWAQPTGAHDAYNIGDKVTYQGKHYICTLNNNVYAPNITGWEVQE